MKLLNYLPIAIYIECIVLLLCIYFNLNWFLKYNSFLEVLDYVLCTVMIVHALFKFKDYPIFSKSSFATIMVLTLYHTIYYEMDMSNLNYYFFYITILGSNLVYIGLRAIIKP